MKAKLNGCIFEDAMEYNEISLVGNIVNIHNTDNKGIGLLKKFKSTIAADEDFSCILNKRDYQLLKSLFSFTLEKKGDVIKVTGDGFNGKFANMLEVHLNQPDISEMVPLGIDYEDIYKGRSFAGCDDKTKIMAEGATILKDYVLISNTKSLYRKAVNNQGPEINVPKEVFKMLDPNEQYTILSNGRCAVFKNGGYALYTNVIDVLLKFNPSIDEPKVVIKANKSELIRKLRILKGYDDICVLDASGKVLNMTTKTESEEINLTMDIEPVKLEHLHIPYSINQLFILLSVCDDSDVTLNFTDGQAIITEESMVALTLRNTCPNMEVK